MGASAKKYVFGHLKSTLANGLIHAYKFEETSGTTFLDSIGSSNGIVAGGVLLNQAGKVARCFSYDGVNDYAAISAFTLNYPFSIKMWVYTDSISVSRNHLSGGSSNGAGLSNYRGVNISQVNNKVDVIFGNGLNSNSTARKSYTTSSACLSVGWNCIHVNVTAFGVCDIYVNGVLYPNAFNTGTATFAELTAIQYRLMHDSADINCYPGSIDELYFWNRSLMASEIIEIYNSENSGISIF